MRPASSDPDVTEPDRVAQGEHLLASRPHVANRREPRFERPARVQRAAQRDREHVGGDVAQDRLHPAIVDAVSQLIGPDVILWGCQIFCKPGGNGMEVPFHQDGHYWPIRPLATCTVWVALDDSKIENGCLRIVPRSHASRTLMPHMREDRDDVVLNQRVADPGFDPATAADIELEAGQMSMHDIFAIHGSNPNRSPKRRAGVAIRYMPGSSVFGRDIIEPGDASGYRVDFSTRPIWLLKGQDRTGRNDFNVGHTHS
ncbi:MAG: phytanoyl-CoA dioxygenase family protein [Alphaproteobacteria bacterium]|nr:phytanoyl-CoA dioxygenase family protein [Alphaproteobacteria bacterium]